MFDAPVYGLGSTLLEESYGANVVRNMRKRGVAAHRVKSAVLARILRRVTSLICKSRTEPSTRSTILFRKFLGIRRTSCRF